MECSVFTSFLPKFIEVWQVRQQTGKTRLRMQELPAAYFMQLPCALWIVFE